MTRVSMMVPSLPGRCEICIRKNEICMRYAREKDTNMQENMRQNRTQSSLNRLDFLMSSLVTSFHDVVLQVFEMQRLTIVSQNGSVARERALDIARSHRREFHQEYVFSCHGSTFTLHFATETITHTLG